MDLSILREWLIKKGISAEYLDRLEEAPIIRDVGEGLLLSLQNDDDIGQTLVMILAQMEEMSLKLAELKQRVTSLEGGVG